MDAMRILDRTVRHFRTLSILFPSASSIRHIQVSKDVRRLGKRFQQQKANSLEPESAAQNNSPGLRTAGVRDSGSTSLALGGRGELVGNANRNQAVGGVTASGAKTFQSPPPLRAPSLRGVAGCARGDKLGRASAVQLPEDLNWKQWEVQGSGQTWQASAW